MYFMIIISIIVEGINGENKSWIDPNLGVIWKHVGEVIPNVNQYDLIVRVSLDWYRTHEFRSPTIKWNQVCGQNSSHDQQLVCQGIWPLYAYYVQGKYNKQMEIFLKLTQDLPAILPQFLPDIRRPQLQKLHDQREITDKELLVLRKQHLDNIRKQSIRKPKLNKDTGVQSLLPTTWEEAVHDAATFIKFKNGDFARPLVTTPIPNLMLVHNQKTELPRIRKDAQYVVSQWKFIFGNITLIKTQPRMIRLEQNLIQFLTQRYDALKSRIMELPSTVRSRLMIVFSKTYQNSLYNKHRGWFRQKWLERKKTQDLVRNKEDSDTRTRLLQQDLEIWLHWIKTICVRLRQILMTGPSVERNQEYVRELNRTIAALTSQVPYDHLEKMRVKRFLPVINLIWNVADTVDSTRKRRKIETAINEMQVAVKASSKEILNIREDMIVIFQKQLTEMNNIKTDLNTTRSKINGLFKEVAKLESWSLYATDEIAQLHLTDYFLAKVFGKLEPLIGMEFDLLDRLHAEIDKVLGEIVSLRRGHFSPALIEPTQLRRVLDAVQVKFTQENREYELVFPREADLYAMKVQDFAYSNSELYIQLPLYVRHYQQPLYALYKIQTVAIGSEKTGKKTSKFVVNWQYFGMEGNAYMQFTQEQLNQCVRYYSLYLCTEISVIQHIPHETCVYQLYTQRPIKELVQSCEVSVQEQSQQLEVYEVGPWVLVNNVQGRWRFRCDAGVTPPEITGATYAVINRAVFCGCELQVEEETIPKVVTGCSDLMNVTVSVGENTVLDRYFSQWETLYTELGLKEVTSLTEGQWQQLFSWVAADHIEELKSWENNSIQPNIAIWREKTLNWVAENNHIQALQPIQVEKEWWPHFSFPWKKLGKITLIVLICITIVAAMILIVWCYKKYGSKTLCKRHNEWIPMKEITRHEAADPVNKTETEESSECEHCTA